MLTRIVYPLRRVTFLRWVWRRAIFLFEAVFEAGFSFWGECPERYGTVPYGIEGFGLIPCGDILILGTSYSTYTISSHLISPHFTVTKLYSGVILGSYIWKPHCWLQWSDIGNPIAGLQSMLYLEATLEAILEAILLDHILVYHSSLYKIR